MQNFSERLVSRRHCLNLSQEEVAEKAGVAPRSIVAWETGETVPSFRKADAVAAALGVDTSWLLYGSPETKSAPMEMKDSAGPTPWLADLGERLARHPEWKRRRMLAAFNAVLDAVEIKESSDEDRVSATAERIQAGLVAERISSGRYSGKAKKQAAALIEKLSSDPKA